MQSNLWHLWSSFPVVQCQWFPELFVVTFHRLVKTICKFKVILNRFTLEKFPNFPNIVQRVASNYSTTGKAILYYTHSHAICKIISEAIRATLGLYESQCQTMIPFTESKVLQVFGKSNLESKNKLFQTILKTPVPSKTLFTPLSSEMFIKPVVSTISLLSQIPGLDSDIMVSEVMLGILLYLSQSEERIKFDELLDGEINSQLGKFHLDKHFRY